MSDIVDELRYGHEAATMWHVAREAADTIERLRAENEKLNGQAAMNGRLLTENAELREENRLVGLQMDRIRMADEIERLRFENETLNKIAVRETVKVATLRTALKPFADEVQHILPDAPDSTYWDDITVGMLRNAAAALKETGDE